MARVKKTEVTLGEALGHEVTDKRFEILRRIGEVGSISEAARGAGVSYKAAWQAIEVLSNLASAALVEKVVGGAGGGGAKLTKAGQRLLYASDLLSAAKKSVLQMLNEQKDPEGSIPNALTFGLRTSMRNQLPCKVKGLKKTGAFIRVELELVNGAELFSRITKESSELLGLSPGLSVLALCKATAVVISKSVEPVSGYNLIEGKVSRISSVTQEAEISLELASGLKLVGFATKPHDLKMRSDAIALLDESGVVLAAL